MAAIYFTVKSEKKEVLIFLSDLKNLLESESFDITRDIVLICSNKPDDKLHSTPYTLLDLEYETQDVIDRLKELTIKEYSETKFDNDDSDPPLLYVFGKMINNKLVYIKLKIRNNKRKCVICISFHYARDKMDFPYA